MVTQTVLALATGYFSWLLFLVDISLSLWIVIIYTESTLLFGGIWYYQFILHISFFTSWISYFSKAPVPPCVFLRHIEERPFFSNCFTVVFHRFLIQLDTFHHVIHFMLSPPESESWNLHHISTFMYALRFYGLCL